MRRHKFITLVGGATALPFPLHGQQLTMRAIGFVYTASPDTIADHGQRAGRKTEPGAAVEPHVAIQFGINTNNSIEEQRQARFRA